MGFISISLFTGCTNPTQISFTPSITPVKPSLTGRITPTTIQTHKPTPTLAIPTIILESENLICAPLEGIPLINLSDKITNKYSSPNNKSDDPHQGVDFSILDANLGVAIGGTGVQAILYGKVATTIDDRFPYGNAIIIETSLKSLPTAFIEFIHLPTPGPIIDSHPILTCPQVEISSVESYKKVDDQNHTVYQSLYLLYAHLSEPSTLRPGDQILCGQKIGYIGNSGNAINPHLHLEVRVGPPGIQFSSISHYDSSATPTEMANYCAWRVSGIFQSVDPMNMFFFKR